MQTNKITVMANTDKQSEKSIPQWRSDGSHEYYYCYFYTENNWTFIGS